MSQRRSFLIVSTLILTVLAIALVSLLFSDRRTPQQGAGASSNVELSLRTDQSPIRMGEEFAVEINAKPISSHITGSEIEVRYTNRRCRFSRVEFTDYLPIELSPFVSTFNGKLTFTRSANPGIPRSDEGIIGTIYFTGIGIGTCDFSFNTNTTQVTISENTSGYATSSFNTTSRRITSSSGEQWD